MKAVHILRVEPSATINGTLFRIRDEEGTHYATKDAWKASLCEQARMHGFAVHMASRNGWYYRDLLHVKMVETVKS